jgi:signal transduction histidine kinase
MRLKGAQKTLGEQIHLPYNIGSQAAGSGAMSAYEFIHKKTAPTPKQSSSGNQHEADKNFDPTRHVAPIVAHELNNILTIIQGYAERLLLCHSDDPALMPHLRLISEASKRAAVVVRAATPPNANETFRRRPQPTEVAP